MRVVSKLPYINPIRTAFHFLKSFGVGSDQFYALRHYLNGGLFPEFDDSVHLKAVIDWLSLAQDVCNGEGVANVFYLKSGWGVAYPETSGYIIATFLAYADFSNDNHFVDRAVKIGDWEIKIQAPNGGVYSSMILKQTRVFNTGQVILGWCALYERTGDKKYLQAAICAGEYLLNEQEQDGTWRKDTFCGARTYHARVDWALLRLAMISGSQSYATAAIKNLKWVLSQQKENGWFHQCGLNDNFPNMHVLIYTLRGLLESARSIHEYTQDLDIMPAIVKGADSLCQAIERQIIRHIDGMVPTSFDSTWHSSDNDSCLTGNAQLSCFLYLLTRITGKKKYLDLAQVVLSAAKRTQVVETSLLEIKGAIAGTYPISHGYLANGFPNWAAKFFADALLLKLSYPKKTVISA